MSVVYRCKNKKIMRKGTVFELGSAQRCHHLCNRRKNAKHLLSRPRIEPESLAWQSDTLQRRHKSRLVPQAVQLCIIPNITTFRVGKMLFL